jgi:membrane protease YdiL (CAAX protease family)
MEKPLYAKILTWVCVALLVVSVGLLVFAFPKFGGPGEEGAVNLMLNWAYVMLGVAIALILCIALFIDIRKNATSLEDNPVVKRSVKTILYVIGIVAALAAAYIFASGAPAMGYTAATPPTDSELKLTDTVLNLTYILGAGAILAIIVGEIVMSVRGKKA